MLAGAVIAQDNITITGTVNGDYQIVDDNGKVYEVADNDVGNEVVELVGKKVQVKGSIMDADGTQIINILSYTIVEE